MLVRRRVEHHLGAMDAEELHQLLPLPDVRQGRDGAFVVVELREQVVEVDLVAVEEHHAGRIERQDLADDLRRSSRLRR